MGILLDILNFVYGTNALILEDIPQKDLFWGAIVFFGFVFLILLWMVKWFFNLGWRFR